MPPEKWDEGSAAANAWIAERLREAGEGTRADPPETTVAVPAPQPATVEPVIREGKIVLPADPAQPELDARSFEEALKALQSLIADLAADLGDEANIDKRAIRLLQRIAERIPDTAPTQAQLFELAHQQETLEDYSRKVVEEWPDLLASRYLGVVRAFDGTMRQFAKWRTFKQNALKDRLTEEQRANAPTLGKRFADALRNLANADFVDPAIADVIEAIAIDIQRVAEADLPRNTAANSSDTRPEDLVTSIDNTLKAIGAVAMVADEEARGRKKAGYAGELASGFTGYVRDGKKVGEDMGKWAVRTLVAGGGVGVAYEFVAYYPTIEQWLGPVIKHLSH